MNFLQHFKLNSVSVFTVFMLTLLLSWLLSTVSSDFVAPGNEIVTKHETVISSYEPQDPMTMCTMISSRHEKGFPYMTSVTIETSGCSGKTLSYPVGHLFNAILVFTLLYLAFVAVNLAFFGKKR